ncbi:MAG: type VII secretion protein EssB [Culicoidibacterales bacterium]
MEVVKIKYGDKEIEVEKTENLWVTKIIRSHTNIECLAELNLLTISSAHLTPVAVILTPDVLTLSFTIASDLQQFETASALAKVDKLRLCANIANLSVFSNSWQTLVLEPENMLYDRNLMPIVAYRGLADYIEPFIGGVDNFLLQYKALAIATLSTKYTFDELYTGALNLVKSSPLTREIAACVTVEAVEGLLLEAYVREKARIDNKLKLVAIRSYKFYTRLAICLSVITILLTGGVFYLGFAIIPYQNTLLVASDTFLSVDYNGTIETLKKLVPSKLPQTSKYELAYSYLQGEPLTREQKEVVANNISLKSDPNYLLFWIYSGRGNFDEALDVAKSLGDVQLTIYALEKIIDATKANTTISGAVKEEQLTKLTQELDKSIAAFETNTTRQEKTANNS